MTTEALWLQSRDGMVLRATLERVDGARGCAVLAHGITGDRESDGLFTALALRLRNEGVASLRFDFRGHGESDGAQEAVTIRGEVADLRASLERARDEVRTPLALVASSFGAIAGIECLRDEGDVRCAVLVNPVLDPRRTFLEPELPWAKASFSPEALQAARDRGFLLLDGRFRVGAELLREMGEAAPFRGYRTLEMPTLVLHGDRDSYVPFGITEAHGPPNDASRFVAVRGGEHGFPGAAREPVVREMVAWIARHLAVGG